MSNVEKIRQEIERRKNKFYKKLPHAYYPESCNSKEEERAIGIYSELSDLLSFLDTLSEEKPSEDLEIAAEEYAPDFSNSIISKAAVDAVRDAFKAGAEWMAEQGYTTETIIDRTPMNGPIGICLHLHDSTGFKIDDKVIVQIRKKQ